MDLADFLLARIAEDEARAPSQHYGADFEGQYHRCPAARDPEAAGDLEVGEANCDCGLARRRGRVLAECEAKRRIADFYRAVPDGQQEHYRSGLGRALRCLALPYADHPDYNPEWKP